MKLNNIIKVVIVTSCIFVTGCTQWIHYPSIGTPGGRVRPTDWTGELVKKCCLPVVQASTGKEIYICKYHTVPECSRLTRESR